MARSSDAIFPLSLVRDKTFQMRQIRRVMWLALFFIVQSTLLLGVFYHNLLGELVAGTAPLLFASEDLLLLNERIPNIGTVMSQWLLAMLAINAVVTTLIGVYILRKLGNPLLAIRRALNDIGAGNLNVRLRTGDAREFSELCDALNGALEQVQQKIEEAREQTRIIETLQQQPAPEAQAVQQALVNCHNVLNYFSDNTSVDTEKQAANGQRHS